MKIFLESDVSIDFEKVVESFHQWISAQVFENLLLIDVADYLHVPSGPGIVLVGHEADFGLDNADGRWGLLYNRKASATGSNVDRFAEAFQAAAKASSKLEQEVGLKFSRTQFQLSINDRALAPNTPATWEACQAEITAFIQNELGMSNAKITPDPEPRRRFAVQVSSETPFEIPASATS